eukprot:11452958-Karenia_brevis.AAC.1
MKFESQVLSREEPPGLSAFGSHVRKPSRGSSSRIEDAEGDHPRGPSRLISHGHDSEVEVVDERPAKPKPSDLEHDLSKLAASLSGKEGS